LFEAANNVRNRVRNVLLSRFNHELSELKRLLDAEAQKTIHNVLDSSEISAFIISEEGDYDIHGGGTYIIVDPVDGTTNLARGIPSAVTSMAVSSEPSFHKSLASLVMDLNNGEVHRAERNKGSFKGGKRTSPSREESVGKALISIDISKGAPLASVERLIKKTRHLRQFGCAALSLCHVASGIVDAYVDMRGSLRATDVAAGLLILEEAGGVYWANGEIGHDLEFSRESKLDLIAASNSSLLNEILGLVQRRADLCTSKTHR
jgi:myo-inositol-1(or 4)-monophosphatase